LVFNQRVKIRKKLRLKRGGERFEMRDARIRFKSQEPRAKIQEPRWFE
jgi:hypothetical protein